MEYSHIWRKVLGPEEEVLHEFSVSERYRRFSIAMWAIMAVALFVPGIIWSPLLLLGVFGLFLVTGAVIYWYFYVPRANAFAFTDKRVIVHRGWLSTNMTTVEHSKVTDVSVREGFIERVITGSGALAINTAGTAGLEVVLTNVAEPYELKKKLDEIVSGKRQRNSAAD